MGSTLQIKYEGKLYPDFSFIQIPDQFVGTDKTFKMEVINDTFYTIEDITFLTNMKRDEYEVETPVSIAKFSKGKMLVTLHTKTLFESTNPSLFDPGKQKHHIMIALDYTRVRKFES